MASLISPSHQVWQWIQRGLLMVLFCLATDAWSVTVMEAYNRALKLYGQGQYRAAFEITTATIRRYPDHQPSYLLAGQIMYRVGKLDRAARFFRKVPLDLLSSDMAYMYGVTFFTVGDCKAATEGLARVSPKDPAAKLAIFYQGICAARARDWLSAERKLIGATPLPPHLETARRRALDQVRNAINAERQAAPLTNITYLYVQPPPLMVPPFPPGAQATMDGAPPASIYQPKKKVTQATAPPSGFTGTVTPNAEVNQTQYLKDYSGYRLEKGSTQTTIGKVAVLGRYNAATNAGGGQPYMSLAGDASLSKSESKGQSSSLVAFADAPADATVSTTDFPSGQRDVQRIAANPEAGYPLGGVVDLTLGGRWVDTTTTGTLKDKNTRQEVYGSLAYGVETQIKGIGAMAQKLDAKGTNVENVTQLGGQLTRIIGPVTLTAAGQFATRTLVIKPPPGLVRFAEDGPSTFDGTIQSADGTARKNWDSFSVTGAAGYKEFQPSSAQYKKAREGTLIKVELSAVKTWSFGLSLTVTGTILQLEAFNIEVDAPATTAAPGGTPATDDKKPAKVVAETSGEQTKGFISLKYAPLSFVSFAVSYDATKSSFVPTDKDLEANVQKAEPSLLTNMTILAGVQTSF